MRQERASRSGNNPVGGIVCLTSGLAIFTLQDVILKLMSDAYPVHQAIAIRAVVALPILALFVAIDGGIAGLASRRAPVLMLRGAIMFTAYTCYYLGLAALPVATCLALYFVAPIMVTILASVLLGERVGVQRWLAILAGFAGILIVLRPGGEGFTPSHVLPLLAGLAYAVSAVMARSLGGDARAPVMAFYANAVYLVGGLALAGLLAGAPVRAAEDRSLAFLVRAWSYPALPDLALLAACGVIAAVGTVLLTQAYRTARASTVAPFEYSSLLWGVAFGWLVWGDWPDLATWVGIAVIVASGIYLFRRVEAGG